MTNDECETERVSGDPGVVLEEARRRDDAESSRSTVVESKIGTIVTIDALIISIMGAVSNISGVGRLISILPAILSAAIGLVALRRRKYRSPGRAIDDFHEYLKLDFESQIDRLLKSYITTIEHNETLTNSKYRIFDWCIILTFLSLVMVLVLVLVNGLFPTIV